MIAPVKIMMILVISGLQSNSSPQTTKSDRQQYRQFSVSKIDDIK